MLGNLDAHLPLLDAIAANPDDAATWAVYADLLQTEEHPRGELISLMMERERRPSSRLLELQRRQLTTHERALLPITPARELVVGWRRGFASELRLDAPEQLAQVTSELSLRFVETATLVIAEESWTAWCAALRAARLPWRRLRIEMPAEGDDAFAVAPLFACCPVLEQLRIAFPAEAQADLDWDGVRGERLKLLVLVNAGEVAPLDAAELPRLEELRLLGESTPGEALVASVCWNRLQRAVLADASELAASEIGPRVLAAQALARIGPAARDDDADDDDDQPEDTWSTERTTAFVVVGKPVDAALLRKLATRLSIAHLSARVCPVRWLPRPLTVLQLFGWSHETDLLPYGLALALQNVLEGAPPIALVEIDRDGAARYLVLADVPARATGGNPAEATRRALDLALGYDPGSAVLQDLLEELSTMPVEVLLGNGGTQQLTMIDPSTTPLGAPEEYDENPDDEEEEDEDYYDDSEDAAAEYEERGAPEPDDPDEDPGLARPRARPTAEPTTAPPTDEVAVTEVGAQTSEAIVEDDGDNELLAAPEDDEDDVRAAQPADEEDALVAPPEHAELWDEFREHWDDRAIAVDDEPSERRWPDPHRTKTEDEIMEKQVAEPACVRHVRALDDCPWCGVPLCVECVGEDGCATCIAARSNLSAADVDLDRPRSS